jgi:iduronate 2-sulfatase
MRLTKPSACVLAVLLATLSPAAEPDFSKVPGTIITHSPASSKVYIGSPGIAVLKDGTYLTKCDEFGPGTTEHVSAVTNVFRSEDQGETWKRVAHLDGLFWANIFTYEDAVYLLGTTHHHGRIVIRRSDDRGSTWTLPTDGDHGLITAEGEYHTAPMPIIEHDGKLWRAVEDAMGGTRWGERYRARMLSIPLGSDLLKAENWTLSEPLARNPKWLDGDFAGWLEGNAVLTPEGEMVNILRVACSDGGKAATVHVSEDGKTLTFDPAKDFIDFPGGSKKFSIRYDEKSKAYWTLANPIMPCHEAEARASSIRNTLALMCSKDLRNWEIRCLLVYNPQVRNHGFQYPDWLFDGDDIIACVRTGCDDGLGGAHNAHDANFLTYHRFADFRDLTMADSVVDPQKMEPEPKTKIETDDLTIEGRRFELGTLANEASAFSNRKYVWQEVPTSLSGWQYTKTGGGVRAIMTVTAKSDRTLYVATTKNSASKVLSGWEPMEEGFLYTDTNRTHMAVFRRHVRAGESLRLPQGSWTGTLLLMPPKPQASSEKQASNKAPLNVLFIAADDLRVELGCYGNTIVKSPNLDRLAARGTRFKHAYCQQALCNPSRASLMTGLRPDTLAIWDLPTHFRDVRPDVVTLPELFKQNGYFTQNIGKVFHNWRQETHGDPQSWCVPAMMHYATHGSDVAVVDGELPENLVTTVRTECLDVPDEAYFDGRIAAEAVEALREVKDRPFFLAVGFWKPHLPFNPPKKYWDMYDPATISLPPNPDRPENVPEIALHNGQELLGKKGMDLTDDEVRELRRGYYAAITYLDAQVGKVLDELDRLELADRTLVVFWSDHGFHLGEHDLWCKTSNFELDAHVPMMIATPKPKNPGATADGLVELLDIYPTVADLCGLKKPASLDGVSLVPILKDPGATVKTGAYTQHPRPAYYKGKPEAMGCSLRTLDHRYTEWRDYATGEIVARELYDHRSDPRETKNLAGQPGHGGEVEQLTQELRKVFPQKP